MKYRKDARKGSRLMGSQAPVSLVAEITHVLDLVRNLIENFVLSHALLIVIASEAYDYEATFFAQDGFRNISNCRNCSYHDVLPWSTCQPLRRCGKTIEPILGSCRIC